MSLAGPARIDRRTAMLYEERRAPEVYAASFELIRPYVIERRVLDVGCGTGVYLKELRPDSIGIDFSLPNVRECRGRGLQVVRCDLNLPLPFADGSFDSVLISHTLEHVDAPIELLRQASRLLNAGGYLVVALPFERSLVRILLRDHYFRGHPTHLYSFSTEGLDRLVSLAGLSRVRLVLDPPLIKRFRLWPVLHLCQKLPFGLARWFCGNFWYVARKPITGRIGP